MHEIPNTIREAATELRQAGCAVCKPDPGEKRPTYKGWVERSLEPDSFGPGDSIGVITGPLSSMAAGLEDHVWTIRELVEKSTLS